MLPFRALSGETDNMGWTTSSSNFTRKKVIQNNKC